MTHHAGIGQLSPEMAILGLLYKEPGYGYIIHRTINDDLSEVWHLSQSQAYAIIKRLIARGDIFAEISESKKSPNKQLLTMTPQGKVRFQEWLFATSGGSTRAIRTEMLTRLYFLQSYDPKKIESVIRAQEVDTQENILRLKNRMELLPKSQVCNYLSIELRINQLTSTLLWFESCRRRMQVGSSDSAPHVTE